MFNSIKGQFPYQSLNQGLSTNKKAIDSEQFYTQEQTILQKNQHRLYQYEFVFSSSNCRRVRNMTENSLPCTCNYPKYLQTQQFYRQSDMSKQSRPCSKEQSNLVLHSLFTIFNKNHLAQVIEQFQQFFCGPKILLSSIEFNAKPNLDRFSLEYRGTK